jgi:hypothetical protein
VVFHFADTRASGHSVNISESGILAVFDLSLDIWIEGQLSAFVGEWHINVEARVVRIDGCVAAFAFQNIANQERTKIQQLIEAASEAE